MVFDRKTLVIPDKTHFEEHLIIVDGDVVIGDRSFLQFGMNTDGRIFVGEHAIIDGRLQATHDVRIDFFSRIAGDIQSGGNVYLGEKVQINGKLSLKGDLDVGDSVQIQQGFEAKGWINIRSPIPIMIYIFIYLMQLLKMGRSEEIERILAELDACEGKPIPIAESFLFIPNDSILGVSTSKVDCGLQVGKECKILGNFEVKGPSSLDEKSELYGSLKATGDVVCGKNVKIYGSLLSNGQVTINDHVEIAGDVSGDTIVLSKAASVRGKLLAKNGISFMDSSLQQATEMVNRFDHDVDVVDEVKQLLG